jgi:hypothetical protein
MQHSKIVVYYTKDRNARNYIFKSQLSCNTGLNQFLNQSLLKKLKKKKNIQELVETKMLAWEDDYKRKKKFL